MLASYKPLPQQLVCVHINFSTQTLKTLQFFFSLKRVDVIISGAKFDLCLRSVCGRLARNSEDSSSCSHDRTRSHTPSSISNQGNSSFIWRPTRRQCEGINMIRHSDITSVIIATRETLTSLSHLSTTGVYLCSVLFCTVLYLTPLIINTTINLMLATTQ